jgi:hypothetical protein
MCQHNQGAIYTWERGEGRPSKILRRPYRCQSWRHEGPCARREAAVTFARMKEAFERPEFAPDGWIFCVLTLDQRGYYSGRPWSNIQVAYRELSRLSRNFMARVRRLCTANGWTSPGSNWVATVECHRSGWPHVNFILYSPELAQVLEALRLAKLQCGQDERAAVLLDGELRAAAIETGWGPQSTAEQARSKDALAGYVVKLAGQLESTSGELAKLTQAPVNAEGKFRRLRSGKGFLPPRRRNPAITGTMIRREWRTDRSAFGALPLKEIADPVLRELAAECSKLEGDRIERERIAKQRAGSGWLAELPPPVESFVLVGENFVLASTGESIAIDGEVYGMEADGGLTWSPSQNRGF